jgi:alkylation response protein AidB-like acyl-CoA dehydrogenase
VVPGLFRAGLGLRSWLAEDPAELTSDGKHYIVNGQKTWTTLGQHADMIFCLVRTDPEAKKQEGISFLLIDMKTPGITVRPIIMLDEEHEVNEVFFDNVKVPVENRVGEENRAGPMPSTCSATSAPALRAWATPSANWLPSALPASSRRTASRCSRIRCLAPRLPRWKSN